MKGPIIHCRRRRSFTKLIFAWSSPKQRNSRGIAEDISLPRQPKRCGRILIESVRQKNAQKRGGDFHRIELDAVHLENRRRDDKLLALDSALDRLEQIDASKAQLIKLRFFSGLTIVEAAQALGISVATAERSWAFSRAWLQSAMRAE